jgi:hypothetical protein
MRAPETEFEDLEALLREDKPAPDPVWARALDGKVAAGFPDRRRRFAWLPSIGLNQAVAVAACGLLAVLIGAAALSAGGGEDADFGSSGGGSTAMTDPSAGAAGGAASGAEAAPASGEDMARDSSGGATALQETSKDAPATSIAPVPPSSDRRAESRAKRYVERSAQLSLATKPRDIDKVASGVARTTTELGGYVAASNISSREGGTLDLRIPSDRLDRAIAQISELGEVRNLTRASVDITAAVVSAKSRLRDARTERSSLLRQLAAADTPNETASVRARLRIVAREIEALKADVRRETRRATFASVGVNLESDRSLGATGDDGSWTPGDAAKDAVRVLEVALGVGLIALAIAVPAGLLVLLALTASRIVTRRRRERALDLA